MNIWNFLQKTKQPIILYGMGNGAELVIGQLDKIGKRPSGIFASDDFARGQKFCGFTVQKYSDVVKVFPDMIILVCFGSGRKEVLDFIDKLSKHHIVLCPDVPVYGETVFDIDFARKHADELHRVYELLDDRLSRETFKSIVEFKLSGKTKIMRSCEYRENIFIPLDLSKNEVYVDLGAYRGDTVEQFVDTAGEYRKIIALEPAEKTYKKLCENVSDLPEIYPICGAVGECDGESEMSFAGRGSAIGGKGKRVTVYSLDTLLAKERPTLIKFDVEGQEAATLRGGVGIISAHKPKMIVAAYHRSEDIFALPLLVNTICPQYRILMRHSPHNLAWDTNFYFV